MTDKMNPYGLLAFLHWNHDWNQYHFPESQLQKAVDQIKELGSPMIRLDILWSDVHAGPGQFTFDRYDRLFSLLEKNNISVLTLLHYNKQRVDAQGQKVWNQPPESFEEFAHYVKTAVARYKSYIRYWEIWNEPNLSVYWSKPKDELKTYSHLLEVSYQAAKKADPTCTVLNGGLTAPILEDVTNLYKQGAKPVFDILSIHTFLDPLSTSSLVEFGALLSGTQNIMDANGDQMKKIWITEMGCPGIPKGRPAQRWFAGDSVDEGTQAEWLETIFTKIKTQNRVEKLFWAFYRDTQDEFKDGTDFLGLVRNDFSPKPAFTKYKQLIRSGQ